jgi:hypothetical protein
MSAGVETRVCEDGDVNRLGVAAAEERTEEKRTRKRDTAGEGGGGSGDAEEQRKPVAGDYFCRNSSLSCSATPLTLLESKCLLNSKEISVTRELFAEIRFSAVQNRH